MRSGAQTGEEFKRSRCMRIHNKPIYNTRTGFHQSAGRKVSIFSRLPYILHKVLINLLSNAVKFTEKGKIIIDARLENNDLQKPKIRIRVQDTGIGLTDEAIKKLFSPFVQADGSTARKYGGTGLGLSICKRLVELMQGEIGVESKEGVGSIFWFTAVFEAANRRLTRFKNENSQINFHVIPDSKIFKILVAEDNSTNQLLTLSQLKSLGYTAQAVANGIEAVSAFRTNNFDLILMDCQMPEMDGFDATREIRKLEAGSHSRIPIIALTANAMKEDEAKCKEVGMDDYLSKPTKKEKLGSLISKWLMAKEEKKAG
jgi:CheY-like chemotaxis protein